MNEMKKALSLWKVKLVTLDLWFSAPVTFLNVLLVFLFVCFVIVMSSGMDGQSIKMPLEFIKALFHPEKKEILTFLGLSMGGILLAMQAVIANRRAKAMEKAAGEQAKANENTEKGQRQERLKNAIEHLGNTSDSVRLGGVYELFHLAEDTKEWRKTILDILCAHIRQTTSEKKYRKQYLSKPSEEIQSLLTLLFVQEHAVFEGFQANLKGSWLKSVDLRGARLQGANFDQAHLQNVDLDGARLQGVNFFMAHLQGASLVDTQLKEADLPFAQLQNSVLERAQLQEANLLEATLQGAHLADANLQGAKINYAHLQGAYLAGAQLQGAYLAGAQLGGIINELNLLFFEERIQKYIGAESELSEVIFAGGLTQEDVNFSVEGLSAEAATKLCEKLTPHINQEVSCVLPADSGAITEPYTKEDADRWIAQYSKATSATPNENDS